MSQKERTLLKLLRNRRELTQKQLAAKIGITPRYVIMLEQGQRNPSLEIAKKIAEEMNTTIDAIF